MKVSLSTGGRAGVHQHGQVAGDGAVRDGVQHGALQLVGEAAKRLVPVQLTPLAQGAGPGVDGGHGIGGGVLAPEPAVIVLGDGAVGGLVFVASLGVHQDAGHHGQGAEGGGDHVAHHVAVVVLQRPDHAAVGADDAGHGVVDQGIEIGDPGGLEALPVLLVVKALEGLLKKAVVLLHDGVLGGEPEVPALAQGVLEAGAGEVFDGAVLVEAALEHARPLEVVDRLPHGRAVRAGEQQLGLARAGDAELRVLVEVAVAVPGHGDGLGPAGEKGPQARCNSIFAR